MMFTLELKVVRNKPLPERIVVFEQIKSTGTELFKEKNYVGAVYLYEKALSVFIWPESESDTSKVVMCPEGLTDDVKDCLIKIYLNIAICNIKLDRHSIADIACDEVLKLDSKNTKALYRKALAITNTFNFDNYLISKFIFRRFNRKV